MQTYIIDGHNLIYRVASLRRILKEDPEHARTLLIRKLAGLVGRKNIGIHLVFDGDRVGRPSHQKHQGVKITYSIKPQTADTVIKLLLLKARKVRSITVVSSDSAVMQSSKSHGANAISAEQFLAYLAEDVNRSGSHNDPEMDEKELAWWTRMFESGKDD